MKNRSPRGFLLTGLLLLAPIAAWGQQDYVGRYDIYNGFTYLDSPHIGLAEHGYHLQTGVNVTNSWALGFDYSVTKGNLTLDSSLVTEPVKQRLTAALAQFAAAGMLPPGYNLTIPVHSTTQTFAAGPQYNYRRFSQMTLFIHPSLGAIYEVATPRPTDGISRSIVSQLAPSGEKTNWVGFYGVGGGADLNVAKHFSIRVTADYVRDYLFADLLKGARNTLRLSVGPTFRFGRNIAK